MNKGIFTISLDFELHWGVSHRLDVEEYKDNLNGTREAITKMLQLFSEYEIHVTWATVGFLFADNKLEINTYCPSQKPNFLNRRFNNYKLLDQIGENEDNAPFHYASSVIQEIAKTPFQEIASHTFSHLFTLEDGVQGSDFEKDIISAKTIAKDKNYKVKSIVFPRNQYNNEIIEISNKHGLIYRGNPNYFYHNPMKYDENNIFIRILRGLDSYLFFFPKICFDVPKVIMAKNGYSSVNVPGSRFLRPYNKKLVLLEGLKLSRIKSEMNYAAKNNKLYHLWWHPHNFGANINENLRNLEVILRYFRKMKQEYGMISKNMAEFKHEN